MNFAEQTPSKQWATLKYKGEKLAEVWFKPEGEPLTLTFRIPQKSFQISDIGARLTMENLLKAVAIATEEVESWRHGGVSHLGMKGSNPELREPLVRPPDEIAHLEIHVRLKPPSQVDDTDESSEPEISSADPQDFATRWTQILGLEATIDGARLKMESLIGEMESGLAKTLTIDEKGNALNADVAQWTKAKNLARFALPTARDFIRRAIWAMTTPERMELGDLFQNNRSAQLVRVSEKLDALLKERQVLSGRGLTVYQECKNATTSVQAALRTLQSNAAANARKKKSAKDKSF